MFGVWLLSFVWRIRGLDGGDGAQSFGSNTDIMECRRQKILLVAGSITRLGCWVVCLLVR